LKGRGFSRAEPISFASCHSERSEESVFPLCSSVPSVLKDFFL